MKNLKITKGEWKAERNKHYYNIVLNNVEGHNIASTQQNKYIGIDEEVEEANANLIADAGTTANKCGKLPSELLAERNELLKLCQLVYNSFGGGNVITFSEKDIEDFKKAINKTLSK